MRPASICLSISRQEFNRNNGYLANAVERGKCHILVFYCCVTNYHELSGLKGHASIISLSMGPESSHRLDGSSAQDATGCWLGYVLIWRFN